MSQDANPSMTEMHREPAGFAPSGSARSALETPPETEFDALTDLFIGDAAFSPQIPPETERSSSTLRLASQDQSRTLIQNPESDEPESVSHAQPHTIAPRVTALVLGHLPVFASAWANQYARHLAESSGTPVAVLRIRGGYAAVDIVGSNLPDVEPTDSIEQAIRHASEITNQWVLRVGEPDEPNLAHCEAIDELTLLTGIDEAAVVASYQTLKRFGQSESGPEITLAVMAASEENARPIAHKISRATETFLERPAKIVCCIQQISGGPALHVFGGDCTISLEDALGHVRAINSSAFDSPASTDRSPAMIQAPAADESAQTVSTPHEATLDDMIEPDLSESAAHETESPEISSPLSQPPQPSNELLGGFETLAATCPYCDAVTLAMDSSGSLQLIADANATLEDQLIQLTTASGWAADHLGLLALTEPRIDESAVPLSHLVTTSANAVRRLLDSPIRIHLRVNVPGGQCVTVPLNHA